VRAIVKWILKYSSFFDANTFGSDPAYQVSSSVTIHRVLPVKSACFPHLSRDTIQAPSSQGENHDSNNCSNIHRIHRQSTDNSECKEPLSREIGFNISLEVLLQCGNFAYMNRFTEGLRLPSEDEAIKTYRET